MLCIRNINKNETMFLHIKLVQSTIRLLLQKVVCKDYFYPWNERKTSTQHLYPKILDNMNDMNDGLAFSNDSYSNMNNKQPICLQNHLSLTKKKKQNILIGTEEVYLLVTKKKFSIYVPMCKLFLPISFHLRIHSCCFFLLQYWTE